MSLVYYFFSGRLLVAVLAVQGWFWFAVWLCKL